MKEKLKNGKLESLVQRQLMVKLNQIGMFFKPVVTGTVGFPDVFGVVGCYRDCCGRSDCLHSAETSGEIGVSVFVEVKRADGKVSDAQNYWLTKLAGKGAITCVCRDDADDTIQFIRAELRKRGLSLIADLPASGYSGKFKLTQKQNTVVDAILNPGAAGNPVVALDAPGPYQVSIDDVGVEFEPVHGSRCASVIERWDGALVVTDVHPEPEQKTTLSDHGVPESLLT
ncbi:MAG: VRR-NUC domain-containing protein [Bacteroidia bacterium]|nr:VRR-NUC domain-containing protein [Bacteroidia bacterium]